jgi:hypothetical protein
MPDFFEWVLANKVARDDRRRRTERRVDRVTARRRAEGAEDRLEALEQRVGEMALFLRALSRVLVEKGAIDRADFVAAAKAVDAQDGSVDGRHAGPLDAP